MGRREFVGVMMAFQTWPLQYVALGVSVADQGDADELVPELLNTPAALRFVSYEPAIGLARFANLQWSSGYFGYQGIDALRGIRVQMDRGTGEDHRPLGARIDLVIVGGESGKGARPFDLAWARSTVSQCAAAGVAAMVKQLGRRPIGISPECDQCDMFGGGGPKTQHGTDCVNSGWALRDSHGGDPLEWPEDLRPYAASPERWPWGEAVGDRASAIGAAP